jgi:hypothetical protein
MLHDGPARGAPAPSLGSGAAHHQGVGHDKTVQNAEQIASGAFGETTTESVLFEGRAAVARTMNAKIDPDLLRIAGVPTPVNGCFIRPASTAAAWGKSLFITDPAIVQDPLRTWDPCTGAGVQG